MPISTKLATITYFIIWTTTSCTSGPRSSRTISQNNLPFGMTWKTQWTTSNRSCQPTQGYYQQTTIWAFQQEPSSTKCWHTWKPSKNDVKPLNHSYLANSWATNTTRFGLSTDFWKRSNLLRRLYQLLPADIASADRFAMKNSCVSVWFWNSEWRRAKPRTLLPFLNNTVSASAQFPMYYCVHVIMQHI